MVECLGTRGSHVYASVSQIVITFFRNLLIFGQSLILVLTEKRCIDASVTFTLIPSLARVSTSALRAKVKLKSSLRWVK